MTENRYEKLATRVKAIYPRFNVKPRRNSWLKPVFYLLGRVTGNSYNTFHTTIFSTMYTGPTWETMTDDSKYKLLRHEMVHIQQAHTFPLGRWAWPVNHLLWSMCYILTLPAIWTLRAKFEREGYTQSLLVDFELNGPMPELEMESIARRLSEIFGGSSYMWMWRRKKAYAWAMKTMRDIHSGKIVNNLDRINFP